MNSHDAQLGAVRRYIDALGAGDAATLTNLFTPDGEVISPLAGRLPAGRFFDQLGAMTDKSELTLLDILVSASHPRRVAAYFRYRWTLRSGLVVDFDCCDIFEFAQMDDGHPRVELMTIIYDTAPVRERMS
jgi:ketosteroid isomerase-like protein